MGNFYPRPPRGGRQLFQDYLENNRRISIHALREEGDLGVATKRQIHLVFLSTPSARRATDHRRPAAHVRQISIHALREEGDLMRELAIRIKDISIHALREEGDVKRSHLPGAGDNFYPRPPRGGRRRRYDLVPTIQNFYPRPPRGGRPGEDRVTAILPDISIHALREEGDVTPDHKRFADALFLSTPSARRATCKILAGKHRTIYFYPRPPRGGRPCGAGAGYTTGEFLSTPSARRATPCLLSVKIFTRFLSTPSARRATYEDSVEYLGMSNFYPRPPRGGRRGLVR